jgi:hypothetical protein
LTRDEFERAGRLLYGESWIGAVSEASGIERRSIARMAAGKIEVPADLAEPLRRAALVIGDLRAAIDRYEFTQPGGHPVTLRTRALLERSLNRIFEK